MTDHRRSRSAAKIIRGKKSIFVDSPEHLQEVISKVDLRREVLRIRFQILPEMFYVFGDQTPFNRFSKHAPTVKLQQYSSLTERNELQKPFYRDRRERFGELRNEERINGLLHYAGLSWRPCKDEDPRMISLVSAFKGLEDFLRSYYTRNPVKKIRLSRERNPVQAETQGIKIGYSMPSLTGGHHYVKVKNGLHSVAVLNSDNMYEIMARMWSHHMCGEKGNMLERFGDYGKKDRPIRFQPLCQHDVAALLQLMYESQIRLKAGENIDSIYDRHEGCQASIPMYLNPIPIATPNELHDFRVLYKNATIIRPQHDIRNGGYRTDAAGNIMYREESPLWEAEIEPVLWTGVANLGKDAMFIRQKVVDLPFFE